MSERSFDNVFGRCSKKSERHVGKLGRVVTLQRVMFTTARLQTSLTFWTVADRFRCSPKRMDIGGTDVSFETAEPMTLDRVREVGDLLGPVRVSLAFAEETFGDTDGVVQVDGGPVFGFATGPTFEDGPPDDSEEQDGE